MKNMKSSLSAQKLHDRLNAVNAAQLFKATQFANCNIDHELISDYSSGLNVGVSLGIREQFVVPNKVDDDKLLFIHGKSILENGNQIDLFILANAAYFKYVPNSRLSTTMFDNFLKNTNKPHNAMLYGIFQFNLDAENAVIKVAALGVHEKFRGSGIMSQTLTNYFLTTCRQYKKHFEVKVYAAHAAVGIYFTSHVDFRRNYLHGYLRYESFEFSASTRFLFERHRSQVLKIIPEADAIKLQTYVTQIERLDKTKTFPKSLFFKSPDNKISLLQSLKQNLLLVKPYELTEEDKTLLAEPRGVFKWMNEEPTHSITAVLRP